MRYPLYAVLVVFGSCLAVLLTASPAHAMENGQSVRWLPQTGVLLLAVTALLTWWLTCRATESALRRERDRAQQYLDIVGVLLVVLDTAGRIVLINRRGSQILGWPEGELLGKDWFSACLRAEDRETIQGVFRQIVQGDLEPAEYYRNWVLTRDGMPRLIAFHNTLIRDAGGHVTGLLASGEDITERTQTEEQIRKLFLAVEQSPASVVITDPEGRIEYVNLKFAALTGYSREEAIGQNPRILKSGEKSPEEYQRLWETITGGREWRGEFHNKKKNGDLYWEAASISPVKNAEGRITHFVALKEDITARKRVEAELAEERHNLEETVKRRTEDLRLSLAQLEAANQAKSKFLSNISHELRSPLNAILGFNDLLKEQFFGPLTPRQRNYVDQIEHSGKHLLSLINDLLDITKVDAGAVELECGEVAVGEFVESAAAMLSSQFHKKNLALDIRLEPGLPPVWADLRRCKQIMLNLLSNACKYTPPAGRVEVRASAESPAWVRVTVSDTGMGIAPQDLDKIFSEFHQADRVRDEQLGGTGIGLALSRRLVHLHGGEIGVDSRLGQGSTFWFSLPVYAKPAGDGPDA